MLSSKRTLDSRVGLANRTLDIFNTRTLYYRLYTQDMYAQRDPSIKGYSDSVRFVTTANQRPSNQPSPSILKLFVTVCFPLPTDSPSPPLNCLPPSSKPIRVLISHSPSPIVPDTPCCRGPPLAEMRLVRSLLAAGPWPLLPTQPSSTTFPRLPV